jgi:hypothetical protein
MSNTKLKKPYTYYRKIKTTLLELGYKVRGRHKNILVIGMI